MATHHSALMSDSCNNEWFRQWFGSPYYDLLYSHRDANEAENFLRAVIDKLELEDGASILDLACGNGRHSQFLHLQGFEVIGIDLSADQIAKAKQKEMEGLHFMVDDMRTFHIGKKFDCIMNLFTSFGYFDQIEDNTRVLKSVREHLTPGGLFLLDYFNAELIKKAKFENTSVQKEHVHFDIHKSLQNDFVIKKINVKTRNNQFDFEERVQLLDSGQLKNMMLDVGLTPIAIFGNYDLENFNPAESERLIIIARN